MIPVLPGWFVGRVRAYDAALRLRWSQEARQFCLERRISNATAEQKAKVRAALAAIVSKPLKAPVLPELYVPVSYWDEQKLKYRDQAARRIKVLDELRALNDGHILIMHVPPPLNEYTLRCLLYTLRATDVWAQGGADKMAAGSDYQEELDDRRRARSVASDHHELAADAFMHSQAKSGERIAFNPTKR